MTTKTKRKFDLADVDGTIPGVAVMVILDMRPDTPENKIVVSRDRFIESDTRPDPQGTAEALWESIKADWPAGHVCKIALNERARFLMTNRRMGGLSPDHPTTFTPRQYWENYS